ncbi:hypothetical protein ACMHYB_11595 [Sorangium sp. So ce1128]
MIDVLFCSSRSSSASHQIRKLTDAGWLPTFDPLEADTNGGVIGAALLLQD